MSVSFHGHSYEHCLQSVTAIHGRLLAVLLEVPGRQAAAAQLLAAALASAARTSAPDWPRHVAEELDRSLRDQPTRPIDERGPESAMGALIAIDGAMAHVVTAGDLRVHLLADDSLVATAWEHTLARAPDVMPELPRNIHGPVPTRCIGGRVPNPVEEHHWDLPTRWRVVALTSGAHGGHDPVRYLGRRAWTPELRQAVLVLESARSRESVARATSCS